MSGVWRIFWLFVLCFHAVIAAAWWWLMPGGFPLTHPRFWSNRVAPLVVLADVVIAIIASRRNRLDHLRTTFAAIPAVWLAVAVVGKIVFPISLSKLFALPLAGAVVMGAAVLLTFRRQPLATVRSTWIVVAVAVLFGVALPLSQRPPTPDTRPLGGRMLELSPGASLTPGKLGTRLFVHPGDGSVTVKSGTLTLSVNPLLRFLSRSPDGCLTILAPPALREGPNLRLTSAIERTSGTALTYRADYSASLQVGPDSGNGPILLEAMARLPHLIYSHLNSFCDIEISGHRRLSLSFSPCPEQRIEVRPADYPVGRPLRMAYLDAAGGFHVVEATSGEKGPFRELAVGRLGRSQPLGITLYDGDAAVARVILEDWSAQAGMTLSPAGGWGIPVNAIEFSLTGNAPGSSAAIYLSLASTSVGRGWDSVGHSAGTYRNRMKFEFLDDRTAPTITSSPPSIPAD